MSNAILLAPGPVQLHPEVQKILAQPMIHHRTPEFDAILKRVLQDLKFLFQTTQPVFMHTSTGSGGMESLLVNLLSPNDEVLAIVSGKFGERWADMAALYGAKVHRLDVTWGEAVNPDVVQQYLDQHPQTRLVLCQATETSTATAHNIEALGKIISKTSALFLVDGITATGAYNIPMDTWHIDGLVAGSQKAVMLPTGLSFVCLSEKAWKVAQTAPLPRFYFDLRKEYKANQNGETLFSSSVPLIKALDFVLTRIQEVGLQRHFLQLRRRADFTRELARQMNLQLFSKSPSDSVTALCVPEGIDGAKLRTHLEQKYQVTVMGGQDQLKGKILRIGHMGYIRDEDMVETMTRLAQALQDFQFNIDPQQIKVASENWLKSHTV
ncbi:pyridoxal-phosphate-dependent aminotransferase family protein [Pseudobdellovibrio exovorus]|uniref:Aspartate aminotransferase, putative n=1 Tax=Pseudobdellovibrio exovorus JSS TaxID=1184267 RepID=M4VBR3_9BACT|nr:alanine--glyoxylate aminotransferase family protein [Pseudobdellovibrio exovorus]AGH95925.1 aspartate aminotransferase, putative [Pseudobdellovibrio exovorus JSS]